MSFREYASGLSQKCAAKGQETMLTDYIKGNSNRMQEKKFLQSSKVSILEEVVKFLLLEILGVEYWTK